MPNHISMNNPTERKAYIIRRSYRGWNQYFQRTIKGEDL